MRSQSGLWPQAGDPSSLGLVEFFHMSAESGLDPGDGGKAGGFRPLHPPQSSVSHRQIPWRGE